MIKQRHNIIGILDVGSSKISCIIAKVSGSQEIEILGKGYSLSLGIKAGVITDLKSAINSIIRSVEIAEKQADVHLSKIYVSVPSNNLLSHIINVETGVAGHEINSKDINKIMFQALDKYKKQNVEVIHSFMVEYILDGNRDIKSPLGMYGNTLGGNLHVISSPINTLTNLLNCFSKCQLEIENYISSAYASGIACLTKDEIQYGITLIDFGGGCTSVSIFDNGHLIHTEGIAMGGINVTNDIARGLNLDFQKAERIKNIHGTVIFTEDSKDNIEVELSEGEIEYISKSMLVEIVRARIEEILEILLFKLRENGYEAYTNKIVITGGGSALGGLQELLEEAFSAKVRIGRPNQISSLPEEVKNDVVLSSSVGMILHVLHLKPELSQSPLDGKKGMMNWLKSIFLS